MRRPSVNPAWLLSAAICETAQPPAIARRQPPSPSGRSAVSRAQPSPPSAAVAALIFVVPFRGRVVVQVLEEPVGQTDDLGSGVFAT